MACHLRWILVLILSDIAMSRPGMVMVREEEGGEVAGREKSEVMEELERWRCALRSEWGLGDGLKEVERMEEMETDVREKREVGAETGKRIEIKSNDAIAPAVREQQLSHGVILTVLKW